MKISVSPSDILGGKSKGMNFMERQSNLPSYFKEIIPERESP